MKTNKILAVALSAGLVLGGASVANAAVGDKYESKEAAEAAAKEELKENKINNSYEVTGEGETWYYTLKFNQEKAIAKEKEELKPSKDSAIEKINGINLGQAQKDAFIAKVNAASSEKDVAAAVKEANELYDYLVAKMMGLPEAKEGQDPEKIKEQFLKATTKEQIDDVVLSVTNPEEYEKVKNERKEAAEKAAKKPYWQRGLFKKNELEDALATERSNLMMKGLDKLFDVRPVLSAEKTDDGEALYAIETFEKPAEDKKPGKSIPWTKLTPATPNSTPDRYPEINVTPTPGEDNEVVLPEEKPEDKKEDKKETEVKEEKTKTSKDKKEEAKPARKKGNNPKTGIESLAPIYSTLAISMAGIVAARKKND